MLDSLDRAVGDRLERWVTRHHQRRLRRLGWAQALAPTGPRWWAEGDLLPRSGNTVGVHIDGAAALPALAQALGRARSEVHIANWHASPDFRLTRDPDAPALRDLLGGLAERMPVRVLLWAGPPAPVVQPTRVMAREAYEGFTSDTLVSCALDARERTMHCHHEKIVIIDGERAFVGGIDLTAMAGDRYDSPDHPPTSPMAWHDAAVELTGPVVADVARHFALRWAEVTKEVLPEPIMPKPTGDVDVQIARTVPERTYRFARRGVFTVLDGYLRALGQAREFIYLENQFVWSAEVTAVLADKLAHPPSDTFRVVLVLPAHPDTGADTTRGQLGMLMQADGGAGRLLATTLTALDGAGTGTGTLYVHAKIGIVDDRWLTVGSANLNDHSLFNDTELNVITCDPRIARDTRLRLWAEHLQLEVSEVDDEPHTVIDKRWRPIATEELAHRRGGAPPSHRLSLLPAVSRRAARLGGPLRGLLVDG
jgi:phosphatidylserine/phosphatidylglycerophosphate/cardiolipin synthase-like enzyme